MSIHKRQCSAACKTAASNCSSERPSHVVDVHVIRTLLWTLHRSYMIERKASGYIHRFHGHRRFMHTWVHQSVRRMHTFNVSFWRWFRLHYFMAGSDNHWDVVMTETHSKRLIRMRTPTLKTSGPLRHMRGSGSARLDSQHLLSSVKLIQIGSSSCSVSRFCWTNSENKQKQFCERR